MFVTKLKDGTEAHTFAYLADNAFVTEFYGREKGKPLYTHWDAPAVYIEGTDRVDQEALRAYHEVNCELFTEEGGAERYAEEIP